VPQDRSHVLLKIRRQDFQIDNKASDDKTKREMTAAL